MCKGIWWTKKRGKLVAEPHMVWFRWCSATATSSAVRLRLPLFRSVAGRSSDWKGRYFISSPVFLSFSFFSVSTRFHFCWLSFELAILKRRRTRERHTSFPGSGGCHRPCRRRFLWCIWKLRVSVLWRSHRDRRLLLLCRWVLVKESKFPCRCDKVAGLLPPLQPPPRPTELLALPTKSFVTPNPIPIEAIISTTYTRPCRLQHNRQRLH